MKTVKIENIFTVTYGGKFSKIDDYDKGNIPVIKSQGTNNGVIGFFEIKPNFKNVISVARTGSVGSTFYQQSTCYITDDCMVLTPKVNFSKIEMLFFVTIIGKEAYKYSYARKVTPERLQNTKIPKLQFLLKTIGGIEIPNNISNDSIISKKTEFTDRKWEWFNYGGDDGIFIIKKGKRLTKANMIKGKTPFIGSIDNNNGYRELIGQKPIHTGNTITVNYNGSVAEAFYQPKPFWASDDVNVLYPKFTMNKYIALFIVSLIKMEKYRFNYGRKWHLERMNESTIKLPIDDNGNPDWQFMENYIKSLPYSSSI